MSAGDAGEGMEVASWAVGRMRYATGAAVAGSERLSCGCRRSLPGPRPLLACELLRSASAATVRRLDGLASRPPNPRHAALRARASRRRTRTTGAPHAHRRRRRARSEAAGRKCSRAPAKRPIATLATSPTTPPCQTLMETALSRRRARTRWPDRWTTGAALAVPPDTGIRSFRRSRHDLLNQANAAVIYPPVDVAPTGDDKSPADPKDDGARCHGPLWSISGRRGRASRWCRRRSTARGCRSWPARG